MNEIHFGGVLDLALCHQDLFLMISRARSCPVTNGRGETECHQSAHQDGEQKTACSSHFGWRPV